MRKTLFILFFLSNFVYYACKKENKTDNQQPTENIDIHLNLQQAHRLASLPMKCIQNEYPSKTSQVLSKGSDLGTPQKLHPAFYGCFDWHSSVHGHWSLVNLIKDFPKLKNRDLIIAKLKQNISSENILGEIAYFNRKQEYSYERMYGWAWLLKLQEELDTWGSKDGRLLSKNLKPLTNLIVDRYIKFLPKLNHPLRVGTHTNSAFGMSFAYDYAVHSNNKKLKEIITENALRLYSKDQNCPINWEPDGMDFLSPCLEEADLMERVLPKTEFLSWLKHFLPELINKNYKIEAAKVSDRTDGHLVHLDGLNFSRAWVFYRLAKKFPNEYGHLKQLGDTHILHSLPSITDGSYEGEHWLASFALYALSER